ncbi:MAG: hypothetical protein JJE46_14445, partial [Acidimicrobiia bacterium]|nr:hypothetical protein [Acidimicrobiia bacterium]
MLPVFGIAAIASVGINGIGAAATPATAPALHLRSVPHVPIVLDPTPSSPTLVAATPPPTGGLRAASANATFVINWDTGFNNNPSAKAAFQYAVDQWANAISSPVPITIDAGFTALGTNVLGSAGPNAVLRDFAGAPLAHTWFPVALANSLTATDLDPAVADIGASFSSNFAGFYFGTDGKTAGKVDFASVVMHEIGHGLGFIGSYDVSNGVGQICCGLDYPLAFDRFATSAGHALTDDPVPSAQLAGDLQNNQVQFTGAAAQAAAGGAAKLYSPSPWEPGSSYSHLDESTYPAGDVNSLMTPAIGANEVIHSPGPIALGIFADTGWNV